MRRNKCLIKAMSGFGVTCSYEEVNLFKYSAAVAVAKESQNIRLEGSDDGTKQLIHCCSDNFNCEIASQNCKRLCHALGIILAQIMSKPQMTSQDGGNVCRRIQRQPMQDRSKAIEYSIETAFYNWCKAT
jgi:hypothetical protein